MSRTNQNVDKVAAEKATLHQPFFLRMLLKINPKYRVFVGTSVIMLFSVITFFGPKQLKSGHGVFDVDKPEAVQSGMDKAEEGRLTRFVKSGNNKDK